MKFRSCTATEPESGYVTVSGVYLHGKLERMMGYDCVEIAEADTEPFKMLVKKGIDGLKVELDGYPGEVLLYAWDRHMGVPLVANPPFSSLFFGGYLVASDDTEAVDYAKKQFDEKPYII